MVNLDTVLDIPSPFTGKSRKEQLYNAVAIVITALLPLSLTFVLWDRERTRIEHDVKTEFDLQVRETTESVRSRMLVYEQILRGGAALFATSDSVSRGDWHDYLQLLNVSKSYPGIIAIAYVPMIPAERVSEFIERIQKSDISGYKVWPQGDRPVYAPTLYIEPSSDRNLGALGFDIYSEPVRRAALDTARDTGEATITGGIVLSQDVGQPVQRNIALYVPIYRRGTDPATTQQRGAALAGFVGGGFRVNDLLASLLSERFRLNLKIYDGKNQASAQLLAQKIINSEVSESAAKFRTDTLLDLNNRTWTLSFASTPEFEQAVSNDRSPLILVGGLIFSSLIMMLIWSLASTRNRTLKLAREITAELRTKQDALVASEERLQLALQGSDLSFFDWNITTGRVELSERWAPMLGDPPAATTVTIQELAQLVHPDDAPRLRSELKEVLSGEQKLYAVEHRIKTKRGEWLWILSRGKVVERDAKGRALRLTGTNADITARKQVEQMKTEFVGTVSHELRTPLTVVVGSLALLKADQAGMTPDQVEMLEMACENSERLQMLVNDILDFEKIASGAMRFQLQPVELAPFLRHALELNRVYADRFEVRYELQEPLPEVTFNTDPERLMQVLTNLLSNAAKFSPKGAAVTISAEHGHERIRIAVADRGPGIAPEFRSRIFQKFAQADSSDSREKGGTGLGLSICKAIVEKLGGHIGYESEPGKGATFYFELPRRAMI